MFVCGGVGNMHSRGIAVVRELAWLASLNILYVMIRCRQNTKNRKQKTRKFLHCFRFFVFYLHCRQCIYSVYPLFLRNEIIIGTKWFLKILSKYALFFL